MSVKLGLVLSWNNMAASMVRGKIFDTKKAQGAREKSGTLVSRLVVFTPQQIRYR
jgi:hypothetical protein